MEQCEKGRCIVGFMSRYLRDMDSHLITQGQVSRYLDSHPWDSYATKFRFCPICGKKFKDWYKED